MVATTVNVTATIGGAGQNISLDLDANDVSSYSNTALKYGLASELPFRVSINYEYPYAVVTASTVVQGTEFQPLVLSSTTESVTISGGDISSTTSQIVVASDGGLNYAGSGNSNQEVLVTSGNSFVSLAASSGNDTVFLNSGSNTIVAGSGPTTIAAGTGANSIFAGSGGSFILVQGQDTIQLAGGTSSIFVNAFFATSDHSSAVVYGDTSPTVKSTIFFDAEGVNASTVFGGTSGSDTIFAGAGGGYFVAGSGGGSLIAACAGAATLVGGSSGGDELNGLNGTEVTMVTAATETTGDMLYTGAGTTKVFLLGSKDTVDAGTGQTVVSIGSLGSINGGSGSLFVIGGVAASTVIGGLGGSETIFGGVGGGYFTGGTGGSNLMIAGSGAATLIGGGSGDTLIGGSGIDQITAGVGNETLVAGSGANTLTGASSGGDLFSFVNEAAHQTYTINAFYVSNSVDSDTLVFKNAADQAAALASYTVTGGSGMMTLADGTEITLKNYTAGISGHTRIG